MVASSWWANVENGADPREFLVTTQSADAVKDVRDRVEAAVARARAAGREPDDRGRRRRGRHVPVGVVLPRPAGAVPDLSNSEPPADADAVIVTEGNRAALADRLPGYAGREFPFRVWWVRDYGAMSPRAWWRWFTRREPWNPTGGMREWLYERPG